MSNNKNGECVEIGVDGENTDIVFEIVTNCLDNLKLQKIEISGGTFNRKLKEWILGKTFIKEFSNSNRFLVCD